jgi:histidinol-phosphate aminotransferase
MPAPIRPNVLAMTPYSPGKPIDEVKRELGLTEVIKLASNENPLGPSPRAIAAVQAAAAQMHLYPDASAHDLIAAISAATGIPAPQILPTNGSDEAIHILGQLFLSGPEDQIIVGEPSFVRYDASAELAASQVIEVPLDDTWTHDLDAMLCAVTSHTRLVFLANPNNPTGTTVPHTHVLKLLEALPPTATLVLDEAYLEYAQGDPGFPRGVELLLAGHPIILLRTFSKAYGLAGLRLGYMAASPEVIDAANRAREPFNVNSLVQAAAIAALADTDHLNESIAVNESGLTRIHQAAEQLGLQTLPSRANFACIKVGDGRAVFTNLLHKGIIVRPGDVVGMPEFIRVSVGTPEEVTRFLEALPAALPTPNPVTP